MSILRLLLTGVTALLFVAASVGQATAGPIDDLIAAAKKERAIEFYGPSTLTPQGAQALGEAFNKKFGLNVNLRYHPSANMTRDTAKIVTHAAAGVGPEWDLMVVTDAHHATLWLRKLHQTFDYRKLGIDANMIHYDSGAVSFANQTALPAYNTKLVSPQDVPKKWDDLLDPKWKGGKLGVIHSTHLWARLAAGPWGEEKTTAFVRKLAAQKPTIGRPGDMYTRLQLGEVLVAAVIQDSQIHRARKAGAPIDHAHEVQPVISPAYHAGVPKGAAHPNVGHLFAYFLTTLEAQAIWEKYAGQTSAFVPGTTTHKYLQGKQVAFMTQDQAKTVDRLGRQYGKMLGFGR